MSNESRLELKAAVMRARQKLADEFPLQARIEGAQPTLQAAYTRILGHWIRELAPPAAGIAPRAELDALAAMDAIVCGEHGIGCYPFSASRTGIRVGGQACSIRLCAGINFVCRHCPALPGALNLSLPQAAAVGNAFFAFQRRLLEQYPV